MHRGPSLWRALPSLLHGLHVESDLLHLSDSQQGPNGEDTASTTQSPCSARD